jgi:hypothetical protein
MKTIKQRIAMTALVAAFLGAGSATAMEGSVGLHFADFDDLDSGVGVYGHLDVMPMVRLRGEYTSVDHLDLLGWSGAYLLELNDQLDMEFGGFYQFWDFDGPFEDDVYGIYGRGNFSVMDELSLYGELRFSMFDNLDDEEVSVGLGANYAITDQFSADFGAEVYTGDAIDQTFIRLGARFHF